MNVSEMTDNLMSKFQAVSRGLFDVTHKNTKTFEQGFYGCVIVKATKKMKATLGAEREIFVSISTFTEQQQRTIRFVQNEINSYQGRLQPALAIIVHCDKEGSSKLKNWGRDIGISILPIFNEEILKEDFSLEAALSIELYSHDAFDVTGPVSDDANFYGRRDEVLEFARKLQKGQIRTCLGIRKIGKTSIINRVFHEIRRSYDALCIMVDCSRDEICQLDAISLLYSIAVTAEEALNNKLSYSKISVHNETVTMEQARVKLEKIIETIKRPFILVFDEVDYITPSSPLNDSWKHQFNIFWRNIRVIYQETDRSESFFSVLIAGVSTYWFTVESIEGIENAALSFVPEEYLCPMPLGASEAMIRKLGKISGLRIEKPAAEYIASVSGNMPYWSRKCASYVHRYIPISSRPTTVTKEQIEPIVNAFVENEGGSIASVALGHLFRVYPKLHHAALLCCDCKSVDVSEQEKRILRKYGILQEKKDLISGEMMIAGLNALRDKLDCLEIGPPHKENEPQKFIGEWAEEIAALGIRRNILEKKMRELALNFIRCDALRSDSLDALTTRIVKILPETRRKQSANLKAEEIIDKFNWTDLVELIRKEWELFQKLFGDRSEFSHHCQIINDRFDAHAKSADPADFALHRRSLKFLEDKLSKL